MKLNIATMIAPAAIAFCMAACNNQPATSEHTADSTATKPSITEEAVTIQADSVTLNSIVAFSSDTSTKKPIVLIVPEWWGLDDYVKGRAKQLAELGYLAVGVDMYGSGKHAENPDEAKAYATPFYTNPQLGFSRLEAALAKAKTYPQADTNRIAAIGYCFGGSMVLNGAKLGLPVNGVVSFHGGLATVPPQKGLTKAQILVCHGAVDPFVPAQDVATFKRQLDSLSIPYTFKEYANATHAFTNPASTANGKKFNMPIAYNAAADTASWNDMRTFFGEIFK
jgi:dienelactone hydrolase